MRLPRNLWNSNTHDHCPSWLKSGGAPSWSNRAAQARIRLVTLGAVATLVLGGLVMLGSTTAGASGSPKPITIGFIGDLTGPAASSFADGPQGAQAAIAEQNAKGGVNGHKLKLIVVDDESNPTDNVTASKDLVSKGAFGIVQGSSFGYADAVYSHSVGIPETSDCECGESFFEPTYINMFGMPTSVSSGAEINGILYSNTVLAQFFKDIGVTKLAGLAYAGSGASAQALQELFDAGTKVGGASQCYSNPSVPFGTVDFTTDVLAIQSAGCNGLMGGFVDASDIGMAQAIKDSGTNIKQVYLSGYDSSILSSASATAALQGAYIASPVNFSSPNASSKAMLDSLKRYDSSYTGGIPDLGLWGGYLATEIMIYGLELAGKNPTRTAFITNLRKVSDYTAGGILAGPVSFAHLGTPKMLSSVACSYFMQVKGSKFVVYKNKPICGPNFSAGKA